MESKKARGKGKKKNLSMEAKKLLSVQANDRRGDLGKFEKKKKQSEPDIPRSASPPSTSTLATATIAVLRWMALEREIDISTKTQKGWRKKTCLNSALTFMTII